MRGWRRVELVPFVAAIEAGADLVMSAHVALSPVTGSADLPATLAREVMHDLLRDRLGFRGVTITDALDMEALPQGDAQAIDAIAALQAGNDLLLCVPDRARPRGSRRRSCTPRPAGCSTPTCSVPPTPG